MAIVFRIEPGGEEIKVTRPEKLAEASVVLRDELHGVSDGGTVVLTAHERATNAAIIRYVVEYLEYGFADAHGGGYDAKSVAEVCNVLVEYECDPEQFQGLWDRMTQKSSLDQGGQRRCWRTKIPPRETLTAAQLAISALVLGKQEELGKELGVIVWALDTELDTTVPELQKLQAMRHEEQKHIFDELKHQLLRLYADRNDQRAKRLADKILQDVRDSNLGELTDTWEQNCIAHPELKEFNPYKLIRRFEDAIKPPDPKPSSTPTRSMTATEQYQPAGSRSFPIDLRELRHVVGQGLHSLAKRKSMADNSLATIDGIFNAVEEMVKTRQRHRAISLIMQRKATIAEWKRELANPGSTRRPSPKGKGHKRADSGLSVSQYRSVPRLTNGSRSSDNGEGSSRRQEVERPQGRPQASSSSPGQQVDNRDGGSKGKGKGKERVQPAELSSVSTRRQRADNTAASTSTPARQMIPSAATRAGISNHKSSQNGVDGVNGINGLGSLQVDFGNGEDSWRHGDDSWRLGGP